MTRQKGYLVKHSFDSDFVNLMEDLYHQYGEEVFSIQGVSNKHLDIARFSRNFFGKSSNVADVSVDDNANVKEKNVAQYTSESDKGLKRLNSFYMMYRYIKEMYSKEHAVVAVEKVLNGELFVNDFHTYASHPYCYAFDLRPLLTEGMPFVKNGTHIKAPKRSDSFLALIIQSTAYISNQIAGAASYPDFFPILDWFFRNEYGENYREGQEYMIENKFQNFIYSMNFAFRASQSAFTNLSVMDKGYMESLFSDYVLPDGTTPDFDSTIELSKWFFEYYSRINGDEGIFTFPVMTLAISLDENNDYIDPEFVDWSAKVNHEKALANIYQGEPTSLSTCCRLKNDYSQSSAMGYQNSFGVSGLSIGSHRVAGLNLPRLAELEKQNPLILQENLEYVRMILEAHRKIIKDKIDGGFLPLYDHHWIHLKRQYSTVGFIGAYEYLQNKGYDITTNDGVDYLTTLLSTIEAHTVDWQKESGEVFNIEQIPGESMAVRLAKLDKHLGYNDNHVLYSNQYIPLIVDASLSDRIEIQGEFDQMTSGGAILHLNVDDEDPIPYEQFKALMDYARQKKVVYFAINYAFTEFEDGTVLTGRHDVSPSGSPCRTQYTRVVGFLTPVKAWNETRRDYEYPERKFFGNEQLV